MIANKLSVRWARKGEMIIRLGTMDDSLLSFLSRQIVETIAPHLRIMSLHNDMMLWYATQFQGKRS